MKRLLTAGMIAGMALLSGIPAQAQSSGKRIVYCQPKPFCRNGQISVCQVFGEADDACSCKRWSRCFGQLRTPQRLAPSLQRRTPPRESRIPPRFAPRKPVVPPRFEPPERR